MENLKSKSPRNADKNKTCTDNVHKTCEKASFFITKMLMKKLIFFFILFISSQFFAKNENEALFFALFFAFLFAFASYQWAIEAKKEEEKRKKYLYNFK